MRKNIIQKNRSNVVAKVEKEFSPLQWILKFYGDNDICGKLVELDSELFTMLINRSKYDKIEVVKDGTKETDVNAGEIFYEQTFDLIWNANKNTGRPALRLRVSAYGRKPLIVNGKLMPSQDSRYFIEELSSSALLGKNCELIEYAGNLEQDEQIVYLTHEQFENELELIRLIDEP